MERPGQNEDSADSMPPRITRRAVAEASIWFSRLRGRPDDVELLLKCVAWQARSPVRRYAYERVRAVWDELGGLRRSDLG